MALTTPLRILVVDDHPDIRSDVELVIRRQPGFFVAGACGSVRDALQLIDQTKPDLLLLDINLTDGTGFDILEQTDNITFKVIFLTAYNQHAIRAIKFSAIDYLLKPLDETELRTALAKMLKVHGPSRQQVEIGQEQLKNSSGNHHIAVPSQQGVHIIEYTDIIYCLGENGYTTFILTQGRQINSSYYLKEYEEMLPSWQFVRPHQSYLVNRAYISSYLHKGALLLKDGTEIPVSTRKKDAVKLFLRTKPVN